MMLFCQNYFVLFVKIMQGLLCFYSFPEIETITYQTMCVCRVPVSVRHVAIGESNQELAKRNLCIFANLAKSIK